MSAADYAAWTSAGISAVALVVAAGAAGTSSKALRWQEDSAESARRSAEAAERANVIAERALSGEKPPTQVEAESVVWVVEKRDSSRFVLRNAGSVVAEHVSVDKDELRLGRNLPEDAVIRPGEGVDFLIFAAWGHPVPNQITVRWGDPDVPSERVVPMPG